MVLLVRKRFFFELSLFAILLLSAAPGRAAKQAPPLQAVALASTPATAWEEPQFVRADRDGNVFFLRGPKLEVYPLSKNGQLGEPVRLEAVGPMPNFVLEAAMDSSGKNWLLLADSRVRLFKEEREQDLPKLDDQPWSVGFVRDAPIVAVIPRPLEGRKGSPPWLVQAGRDRWDAVVDFTAAYSGDPTERGRRNEIIAESAVFLTGDRQGRVWAGRRYSYRIERFSLGGRRLLKLQVGEGKVRRREKDEPVVIDLPAVDSAGLNNSGTSDERKATFRPFTGQPVVLDLTEARDGNLYLLLRTEAGGLAIDRYDASADLLERRELSLEVKDGRMTIAAGKDGLYLAAWNGATGRWRIGWDQLEPANSWSALARQSAE